MGEVKNILKKLLEGRVGVADAEDKLRLNSIEEIEDFAKFDIGRQLRNMPEVILAQGKTPEQVLKIAKRIKGNILISRVEEKHLKELKKNFKKLDYNRISKTIVIRKSKTSLKTKGKVGIITAGTSDIPIAEEAAAMVEMMGCKTVKAYDAGAAGIHRLFKPIKKMIEEKIDVVIVAAGREGTLPSIVAGIINVPVIGLPTSQGYGYGGRGEAALKSMLQSCSFITVTNIDNGIGAGACAALISIRANEK